MASNPASSIHHVSLNNLTRKTEPLPNHQLNANCWWDQRSFAQSSKAEAKPLHCRHGSKARPPQAATTTPTPCIALSVFLIGRSSLLSGESNAPPSHSLSCQWKEHSTGSYLSPPMKFRTETTLHPQINNCINHLLRHHIMSELPSEDRKNTSIINEENKVLLHPRLKSSSRGRETPRR